MSLLLDALKQAAQDKKHRDALLAQNLLDDENDSDEASVSSSDVSDESLIENKITQTVDNKNLSLDPYGENGELLKNVDQSENADFVLEEETLELDEPEVQETYLSSTEYQDDKKGCTLQVEPLEANLANESDEGFFGDGINAFELDYDEASNSNNDDFLDGFVVKSTHDNPAEKDLLTNDSTVQYKEDKNVSLGAEDILLWSEGDEEVSPVASNPLPEPVNPSELTKVDVVGQEKKRKEALARLVELKRDASKQKMIKVSMLLASIVIISGISLGAYYYYTLEQTQKQIAAPETFEQYIETITSLDTPIESEQNAEASSVLSFANDAMESAFSDPNVIEPKVNSTELNQTDGVSLNEKVAGSENEPESPLIDNTNSTQASDTLFQAQLEGNIGDRELVIKPLASNDTKIDSDLSIDATNLKPEANVAESRHAGTTDIDGRAIQDSSVSIDKNSTEVVSDKTSGELDSLSLKNTASDYVRPGKKPVDKAKELIKRAYNAYQQDQLELARTLYKQSLILSPEKRDAILGAAAVAMRQERYEDALLYYQQLLSISPQDSYAQAGLLSLQASNIKDPSWLSQVNQLLIRYPEGAHLHFLKANANAVNGRWQAAQQSYFDAWTRNKTNPDYAYNLAIALDQLGQFKAALDYYVKARFLNRIYPSNFSIQSLETRINQLREVLNGD